MKIKPCCHYCGNSQHVRKHGVSRARIQRYLCMSCNQTFQVRYIYHSYESNVYQLIDKMLSEGQSHISIARQLGIDAILISRHVLNADIDQ
ncbi:transposase [Budvicia diplopodorum]|uniref:transposase n=1 Tax=Budvicia diplopodorum TaxID=1119056 RepID=UPI003CCD5E83